MVPILAIDPSSKKLALTSTLTLQEDEEPQMWIVDLPAGIENGAAEAYREVYLSLEDIYAHIHGCAVSIYLESPILGKWNPHSTIIQSQASGAILAACGNFRTSSRFTPKSYLISNTSWKKRIVGKGNATKEEIAKALKKIWPIAFEMADGDQDLMDSAMINRYGVSQQRTYQRLKRKLTDGTRSQSQARGS